MHGAVELADPDAYDAVVEAEHGDEAAAHDDLEEGAAEVGGVAGVGGLEDLHDLVAVLDVVLGEAGHVLGGEGLLDQEVVELVHAVLHLVDSETKENILL